MGVKWVYCKAAAHGAWLLDTGFRRYDARVTVAMQRVLLSWGEPGERGARRGDF